MTELKLNLQGCTPRQYAALILRDDLEYTHGKGGVRMGLDRSGFASLYQRGRIKTDKYADIISEEQQM